MRFLSAILFLPTLVAATGPGMSQVLRGRLHQEPGKPPVIQTADQKRYTVSGDEFTRAQMADSRLNGREMELDGHFTGPDSFEAARLFTVKNGKRYEITYWCDVCSIRTHMPGRCMCCQGPTELQELPAP
jgi:hypothetical protein